MIRPRIIPVLLIEQENLIKTIKFKSPIYLGDPINALKIFNEKEVDELCVIDKTAYKYGINYKQLKELADEAFMPLSYGGGIKTIDDAKKIISIGYEKVIINEITYKKANLINELANELGSQSVVVSIDYKKSLFNKKYCCYREGKIKTNIDPLTHAIESFKKGAGEILLTSVNHEGMMIGFDYNLINEVSKLINIPIIAHGGCGELSHIKKVIYDFGANAAAVGSLFVFFGKKRGILINYPDYTKLIEIGVYKNE